MFTESKAADLHDDALMPTVGYLTTCMQNLSRG